MKKSLLIITQVVLTNFFLTSCADDQARMQLAENNIKINNLNSRIGIINNKLNNQQGLNLLNQIDNLQNQINQINGQINNLSFQFESATKTNSQILQSMQLQLDTAHTTKVAPMQNSLIEPKTVNKVTINLLQQGIRKLKSRDFNDAILILNKATKSNSDDGLAWYYLGIAYAAAGKFKESINSENNFMVKKPNSQHLPDALRTIYIAQSQLGYNKSAKATAARLVREFPNSAAAKKVNLDLQQ